MSMEFAELMKGIDINFLYEMYAFIVIVGNKIHHHLVQ